MRIYIEYKDKTAVERLVSQKIESAKQRLVERLSYIGEQCITVARNLPSPDLSAIWREVDGKKVYNPHQPNYIDHSGNLRQSIGYLVAIDGEIQTSSFSNSQGEQSGKSALSNHSQGIVLILVAGMKYAYYVSKKGYDVLDSAIIEMKKQYNNLLKTL